MARHELCIAPDAAALAGLIDQVQACCRAAGLAEDDVLRMTLAIEEAAANVIAHAFAGLPPPHRIALSLEVSPRHCVAELTDNGQEFDPTGKAAPDLSLPLEARDPGGLGIHLMRRMVDRLDYRRSGGDNVLRLEITAGRRGRGR